MAGWPVVGRSSWPGGATVAPHPPCQAQEGRPSTLKEHFAGKSNRNQEPPERLAGYLKTLRKQVLSDIGHCQAALQGPDSNDDEDEGAVENAHADAARVMGHLVGDLKAIDRALERLDRGEYGTCIDCGKRIASTRLEVVPTALRCTSCQDAVDQTVRRAS